MINSNKINSLANSFKQIRLCSNYVNSSISSKPIDSHKIFMLNYVKNDNSMNNLNNNISKNSIISNYICPSIKSFQLPINDFKITDIVKRHELTLPEINKNKIVYDPLLKFQIEKELPKNQVQINVPMSCGRPLYSETKWRSRKMNIKKRKRYQKKMFYIIQKRKQAKEKRYASLCELYRSIHEKKVELFNPIKFVNRELEKAKFYGFKCNNIYDEYRQVINDKMKTFDEKFFRKFDDCKKPLHLKYEEELKKELKK